MRHAPRPDVTASGSVTVRVATAAEKAAKIAHNLHRFGTPCCTPVRLNLDLAPAAP
jgi:hypothetical protein